MTPQIRLIVFAVVALIAVSVVSDSCFVVNQSEQAIILRFGEPTKVIEKPGLKVKWPFIEDVVFLDHRVLDLSPPGQEATLNDQKRLEVDGFALYRITDPLKFIEAFQTQEPIDRAQTQLNDTINSTMREVLATYAMTALLSEQRDKIMTDIKTAVNQKVASFGVEIVDVRIRRADLPEETTQAVFARMRSERQRQAAEFRGEGQQQSQQIRAKADRDRTVILAEAQRDAQIKRGEGEQTALKIIGDAANRDPQFYSFYRSLEAYRDALGSNNTAYVLSPKSDFFRYLDKAP